MASSQSKVLAVHKVTLKCSVELLFFVNINYKYEKPSTREVVSASLKLAWSTVYVPGQLGLHRSYHKKTKANKRMKIQLIDTLNYYNFEVILRYLPVVIFIIVVVGFLKQGFSV